ncbi:MAG: restriction endonuclease subunit S [Nitrospira sp.]|jgi:type I restriction enzyme S subunit|nr:restriction endonuclease subunit S [Nitrospira sp.]
MSGWIAKPLADACERITDGSHRTPPFTEEGYPFATVAHVDDNGIIDLASCKRISPSDFEELRRNDCRPLPGDVLFSKDGTVGKVAVIDFDADFVVLSSLAILRPKQDVLNQRFLAYALRSEAVLGDAINRKSGSAIRRIVLRDLRQVCIPIPPLVEQERIVKLLDEADELRKLRAQADRRTADLIPALFHEMFGENAKKPHAHAKLGQIAEVVSGVAKGRKFNGRLPVEVPYLRVANVQAGHLDLSEIKTIQALPEEVEELALRKGDVLLTEGGDFDKLGRGAMLEQDLPNYIHQNHVFRVRVEQSELDPVYFAKFLLTGEARRYFLGCAKRTTNLASINMTQLRALPVPLPPLFLQKEFAARVSEIRAMQAEQAASRRRLDDLFHSMLHRVFQGEL